MRKVEEQLADGADSQPFQFFLVLGADAGNFFNRSEEIHKQCARQDSNLRFRGPQPRALSAKLRAHILKIITKTI